jgi:hypothetical protein
MHNQPDVPLPENTTTVLKKKRFAEGPPPPPSPPLAPLAPGKDENNVGNKLLKMMGWKEGSGLGTEGDGRVDPMYSFHWYSCLISLTAFSSQTAIYAQGVGLGASKAKEMGKYAEGYSGYVHMVQDVVSVTGPRMTKTTIACRKFLLTTAPNTGSGALWELMQFQTDPGCYHRSVDLSRFISIWSCMSRLRESYLSHNKP